MTAAALLAERDRGDAGTVLDVRDDAEWELGHIDGAAHRWLARITRGEMPAIDRNTLVTVVCQSGYRSTIASSLLRAAGFSHVRNLQGGMDAWHETRSGVSAVAS